MTQRTCRTLDIVIPVFNEKNVLPLLWERLQTVINGLNVTSRIVFVDDGSTDESLAYLLSLADGDQRVGVVSFSRNFGHQAAITAGLAYASADATVVMDADLQDPPELIAEMMTAYEDGADVVCARRRSRMGETLFKKLTAMLFYRVMRRLAGGQFPIDVGDFRLMGRNVVLAVNSMPEAHRFVRGMVAWTGFSRKAVYFDRSERAGGKTKYSALKMFRLAWSAITSFSAVPVRSGVFVGFFLMLACFLYGMRVLYVKFVLNTSVPGWATTTLLQLGFFGLIFFYLGIIGDYVGRIYEEGKRRPLYIVKMEKNMEKAPARRD